MTYYYSLANWAYHLLVHLAGLLIAVVSVVTHICALPLVVVGIPYVDAAAPFGRFVGFVGDGVFRLLGVEVTTGNLDSPNE